MLNADLSFGPGFGAGGGGVAVLVMWCAPGGCYTSVCVLVLVQLLLLVFRDFK